MLTVISQHKAHQAEDTKSKKILPIKLLQPTRSPEHHRVNRQKSASAMLGKDRNFTIEKTRRALPFTPGSFKMAAERIYDQVCKCFSIVACRKRNFTL